MLDFLNKFSEKELHNFGLFIKSHYHNTINNVILLFEYLASLYPYVSKKDISKEKISFVIYGEKEVNYLKVIKLFSDFGDVLIRFLKQTEFQKDDSSGKVMLLRAYRQMGFRNKYRSLLNSLRKKYTESYIINENTYADMYKAESENFTYLFYTADKRIASAYKKKTEALDHFLVYQKLKNYYDYVISEIFLTKDIEVEKLFVKDMLGYVERNLQDIKRHHPYIYLYYLLALFYENYDLKHLNELNSYYDRSFKKFSQELYHVYNLAIISVYLKMKSKNIGDVKAIKEDLFIIYDRFFMNETGEFSKYYGELPFLSNNFLSIANTAISLNKPKWAKAFIDKYKNAMKDELSDDCYNICMMDYNYLIKNYEEAVFYGMQVSGKVPNYYYTSIIMVIRSHYELGNFTRMREVFDNLKQYLKRKKNLNDFDHNMLKTFITYFAKFIKLTETASGNSFKIKKSKKLLELKYEVEKVGIALDSYKWFMEKLTVK